MKIWFNYNRYKILYWLISGAFLVLVTNLILFIFVDLYNLSLKMSTIITGEIGILLRFIVNQYLIFKKKDLLLKSLWNFHLSSFLAYIIWVVATNYFASLGINYLIASLLAILFSMITNFVLNFFWIWKKETNII